MAEDGVFRIAFRFDEKADLCQLDLEDAAG